MHRLLHLNIRSLLIRSCSTESKSHSLISSINPDLRKKITGESTSRRFRLESLKQHLSTLDHHEFPLPKSLSVKEWETLLDLKSFRARVEFFYTKEKTKKSLSTEDLKNLDEIWDVEKLTYDPMDVAHLSPEEDKVFRHMLLFRDSLREEGERVPCRMSKAHIISALKHRPGSRGLRNYLEFLATKEFQEHTSTIKKRSRSLSSPELIAQLKLERTKDIQDGKIVYGLGHNSLLLRYLGKYMDVNLNWNTIREFDPINGSPLVIDLSFLKTLKEKHARSFIHSELFYGISWNKNARSPYAIHLTEFDPSCEHCCYLKDTYPHLFDPLSPVLITEKSYLDLFPKENLLYLSPDSKQDLNSFRGSDIPIIGAIVDPSGNQPLTLGKAKKQGIRHARLPMKKMIGLNARLNVDHMIAIMCEWKNSRDWLSAFRFVPSRFFSNRQKSAAVLNKSRTENQMEIISEAFKSLSPKKTDDILLPAVEYKKQMNELLKKEGLTIDDLTPWKTLFVPSNNNKVFNYLDYVESKNYKKNNLVHRNKKLKLKNIMDELEN
ncbi:mitochondrial ribonuclease P protein 1 homolog [Lepeophtheirus salmonis]|uniref:mitochondrial ribonuclease P protein 1 homolog n=1 Tax=Lepeophtheirus salmonis TaxID=72036 RepID=UPI001AE2545E|nr:mitochondrial ribonuclease P protein 1 homolog [Lepeophtheirus salmonis]